MTAQIGYPFRFSGQGRTATEDDPAHIRHLIEQVLFTIPGERVNRPDFGAGVQRMIFDGTDEHTLAAAQFLVSGELERWLGDVIKLETVDVQNDQAIVTILIQYGLAEGGPVRTEIFNL